MLKRDIGLPEELAAVFIKIIPGIHDTFDPGVDQHFGAGEAGLMRYIGGRAFAAYAVERRLDNGILFCVERADTMPVNHEMPDFIAMGQACGRAVVAGGEDALVAHQHGTNMGTITGAAFGNAKGNVEKILVPGGALARCGWLCHVSTP